MERSDSPNANPPSQQQSTMSIKSVRGLRSYYPTDKGPVDTYQLGHLGRVEYLTAEIAVDHLNKGKESTEEWRKWARERGVASDEVGLILSHRLGGSGIDKTNLFPKSPLLNDTIWKQHEEEAFEEASDMRKWKKIKFSVRLDYPSEESTRPSGLEYQYDLPSGTILYGKVNNTPAPIQASEADPEADEVDEEQEEEYEEEEEEEEEEVVEEKKPEEKVVKPNPTPAPEAKVEARKESLGVPKEDDEVEVTSPIKTVVLPPTPRPSIIDSSPSPPPEVDLAQPPPTWTVPPKPSEPAKVEPSQPAKVPSKNNQPTKDEESKALFPLISKCSYGLYETGRAILTKSDLIDLIPVVGSCKLAYETVNAAINGKRKTALRKAVQCGISLVADFYLGRAIVRHGKILSNSVTEEAVIQFVNKAESQIIIVSTFKATNQLLSTLTRVLS